MPTTTKDPLLSLARVVLVGLLGLHGFAIVMVAIGIGAVLTIQRGELETDIVEAGLASASYWVVVAGLFGVLCVLILALRFVVELRRIVASVELGDPFVPENADRLVRMAWAALAIQVLGLMLASAHEHLGTVADEGAELLGASGGGFALALTLFVLARVFRIGTAMRAELEGTV
ncbi:hypothetical protein Pla163_12070 [Planctomycetes bacterium Pla163]|uniref:DUF2975 domain-containing protein n=1 Tax=Rohdeia mirabilis TaxID=2528008 RepID=A0A518CXZ9_9BACT|nr:hypothetical protein Pla163_12070 [Planctomycetes bacterium Pla163]